MDPRLIIFSNGKPYKAIFTSRNTPLFQRHTQKEPNSADFYVLSVFFI